MTAIVQQSLPDLLELANQLETGREQMSEPQQLPGRYGRVVRSIDHVLQSIKTGAVMAGGWAVWRHGYVGRITQDVDIALAADQIGEFLAVASVAGFDLIPQQPGRWPKLVHKETGIKVDILPEGQRPGTPSRPAPTVLPHPKRMGAIGPKLHYISLPALVELKLAAGRGRDESDVIELIRVNPSEVDRIRHHLEAVHADYVSAFDRLVVRAREQQDH